MAKITDLSNELLLNIVSYLTTGDASDVKALLHLCRTSHQLFAAAQPALYTHVPIAEPISELLAPLKLFLRTLLEHPSLARKTQDLTLSNDLGVRYEWPTLGHDAVFMEISALIGGFSGEIEPELCYYPFAVHILARLPNLQHLHLTAKIEAPSSLVQRLHEMRKNTAFLSRLKTFDL